MRDFRPQPWVMSIALVLMLGPAIAVAVMEESGIEELNAASISGQGGPEKDHEIMIRTHPEPISPSTRGDLAVGPGEEVHLSGSHRYRDVILGEGSRVYLEGCDILVEGDSVSGPSFIGSPSVLVMNNSTLTFIGENGTGADRSAGAHCEFNVTVGNTLSIINSKVDIFGGHGWSKPTRGYIFTRDVGGNEFSGGNSTFQVFFRGSNVVQINSFDLYMEGGNGGDAPKGELLYSNQTVDSGGYTCGGDVSGRVGIGGTTSVILDVGRADIEMIETDIVIEGGTGARAGDGGELVDLGLVEFTAPCSSGGYTSGGHVNENSIPPGTVSGNVGRGGNASLRIKGANLTVSRFDADVKGGSGGDAGEGGSCGSDGVYSLGHGCEPVAHYYDTHTLGGGGGGGYAGGYATTSDGGDGGDIYDRVGSGGDAFVNITMDCSLTSSYMNLTLNGGYGGKSAHGGEGGCNHGEYDGGGGGGGGFSGGAGAAAHTVPGNFEPGEAGFVDEWVGSGGNVSITIKTGFLAACGSYYMAEYGGRTVFSFDIDGESGEIDAFPSINGGEGGHANEGPRKEGLEIIDYERPAPVPYLPAHEDTITDHKVPFEWKFPASHCWNTIRDKHYEFRLLRSMDPDDVVEIFRITNVEQAVLENDPGDGIFYWTVRLTMYKTNVTSLWAPPVRFYLDRTPPDFEEPGCNRWLPLSDQTAEFIVDDDISGLDPSTVRYQFTPSSSQVPTGWRPGNVTDMGCGEFRVSFELEGEDIYTILVRAADKAGNGPVVGGPYIIGVDGTPPNVSGLGPGGWSGGDFAPVVNVSDTGSGVDMNVTLHFHPLEGGMGMDFERKLEKVSGDLHTLDRLLFVPEGNWTYRLEAADRVGNSVMSDPVELLVDRSYPNITACWPAGGAWINSSRPVFHIHLSDPLSGIEYSRLKIFNSTGASLGSFYPEGPLQGDIEVKSGFDLAAGIHSWTLLCRDGAGNEVVLGPFSFGVDLLDPAVSFEGRTGVEWTDDTEITMGVSDTMSGVYSLEFQLMEPKAVGYEAGDMIRVTGPFPDGTCKLDPGFENRDPVIFFRARGIDSSGNIGTWTDVNRLNVGPKTWDLDVSGGPYIGPSNPLELELMDQLGIDMTYLQYRTSRGGNTTDWGPVWEVLSVANGTLPVGEGLQGPKMLKAGPPIGEEEGEVLVELRWKDLLPLSGYREPEGVPVIVDTTSPELILEADLHSEENPYPVNLTLGDPLSGALLSDMEVEVGTGNVSTVDTGNGPDWISVGPGSGTLLINLTWGKRVPVTIFALDLAENSVERSVSVRATRAPTVEMIGGPGDGEEVTAGEELELLAAGSDPDGDHLEYSWFVDGEYRGNSTRLTATFDVGAHTIELRADDGDLRAEDTLKIDVVPPGDDEDDGANIFLLLAAGALLLGSAGVIIFFLLARYRRDEEDDDAEEGEEEKSGPGKKISILGEDDDDEEVMDWEDDNVYLGKDSSESGAKGKRDRCEICLRPISSGAHTASCRCGARFHRRCASREGICPECGREIMMKRS